MSEPSDHSLTGRCLCGQVTWRSDGPILWGGHCHCESCRRACSAPYTSFFGVPRASLLWTGEKFHRLSAGGAVRRANCAICGSPLAYENTCWPEETHLYAATLEDPSLFVPQAHYHVSEKLPWVTLTDQLTHHPHSAEDTP